MGLEFITRIIRTTAMVALLAALAVSVYYDWNFALGMLVGTLWGLTNLFLMKLLIREVISPRKTRMNQAVVLMLVKFPLLYVGGYLILAWGFFSAYSLLAGFSLMFAVTLLKVLGRVVMGMDVPGLTQLTRNQAEGTN